MFIVHGQLKVFVFGLPHAAEVFVGHGLPGWTVYPAAAIELVGGTMLILGIGTRLASPEARQQADPGTDQHHPERSDRGRNRLTETIGIGFATHVRC